MSLSNDPSFIIRFIAPAAFIVPALLSEPAAGQLPQPSPASPPSLPSPSMPSPSNTPPTTPAQAAPGTPAPDGRVQMMQGQGRGMKIDDAASRLPLGTSLSSLSSFRRNDGSISCKDCHDRPPIPIGSHDDPDTGFDGEFLPRRSWAAWWEVNREPYLREARNAREHSIPLLQPNLDVITALQRSTESEFPQVRGEAILALGRMRHADSLELMKRLTGDGNHPVALHAWVAIGLLDSEAAQHFLAAVPEPGGVNRIGWTLAVGLLERPTDTMWESIRAQLKDSDTSIEAKRLALWALRAHQPRGTREVLLKVIDTSRDVELVAEALQGLPNDPRPTDIEFLSAIATGKGRTTSLPTLSQFGVPSASIVDGTSLACGRVVDEADPFETESETLIRRTRPREKNEVVFSRRVEEARTAYLYLREAAIRALGEFNVVDTTSRDAASNAAFVGLFQFRRIFLPQDVLAMAKVGVLEDYYPMADRLQLSTMWHPGFPKPTPAERAYRPGRGNAAMAIGLLLKHLGGGQQTVPDLVYTQAVVPVRGGVIGRSRTLQSIRNETGSPAFMVVRSAPDLELMMHLQNSKEPSELRSACAMALGIGGQKQRKQDLLRVLRSLSPSESPIFGYSMLAMSLWGDGDVLPLMATQIGPSRTSIDAQSILASHQPGRMSPMPLREIVARRAMAQAMAALGDPGAIPLLVGQWGRNPALDLELARAILWCHRESSDTVASTNEIVLKFGDDLANLLSADASPALAASAAASLGALFDNGSAVRLDSITLGQNFLMRGREAASDGTMDFTKAPQQQVLGISNPHYFLTAFGATGRR